jgi:hypothetical protein
MHDEHEIGGGDPLVGRGAQARWLADVQRAQLRVTLPTLKALGFSLGVATGRASSAGPGRLRARPMPKHRLQRYFPTNPHHLLCTKSSVLVSLPGVPHDLEGMHLEKTTTAYVVRASLSRTTANV